MTTATTASPRRNTVSPPMRRRRSKTAKWSALFLSPAMIVIGVFTVIPMLMTIWISLNKWSMFTSITDMTFVGLDNYTRLLGDASRMQAIANTGVYVGLSVLITIPLALLIALLLYFPKLKGKGVVRTLLFATYVIPTIAIVIIWGNIYSPGYGPLSAMVSAIGLTPPGWLSDPQWALLSLVIFNVWQMLGYYVILLIAGLTQINEELYEAARIDGAGLVRQTWSITIPLLRPSLVFVILMTFVNSIQVFDPIYLLTQGGPANSTNVVGFEIQRSAFQYGMAGESSALAVSLFLMIVAIGGVLGIIMKGRKR
ncbi:carbohydrate ABC transporter permease [Microbacterium murale]|uniref:Multiple sugar transport system permease protein n=1 Tax=Microbacterium murale TaxID=1081040 RepID=A0ABU0PBT8_9MICO|nr:sugar ABC transporter permease [Microbacterium murale]MDQ0644793.1 multiple sugar transport system permease protein [Microbacterium murale]